VSSPGSGGIFAFDLDVFDMPVGGRNPADTMNFLHTIVQPQTQVDFSTYKGSSPVRNDIADSMFTDDVTKNTYHDLKGAPVRMLMPTRNEWDSALEVFALSARAAADQTTLYNVFVANPPLQ
jgi:spermidine/putrescine-binding protein